MATPKYDPDVDFSNENLSQPLLALLVGEGKRVLDVGCATGYLAEMLRARGCEVDGVEYDPVMAEKAAPHVGRLEVGDVQAMDLPALFGAKTYDAVVFGDVLEHLTEPLQVLRSALALLKPGGSIVVSLPNVAHGAVRLGLLHGRFAYTPTGLLDETHLRFFTRDSVLQLMADAGLAVVTLRRTVADLFTTEVQVFEGDYPAALVDLVAAEPEATTYQFVLRAVPVAEADPREVRAVQEAEALRDASFTRPTLGGGGTTTLPVVPSARVGLWGSWDVDDLTQAVLGRVVSAELGRRLPGVLLRFAAPHGSHGGRRTGLGEPVEELGAFGPARSRALAEGLDAVLVVGPVDRDPAVLSARYDKVIASDDPTRHLLSGPADVPVLWGPVSFDGAPVARLAPGSAPGDATLPLPDPGVLASRVLSRAAARRRTAYLRSAGWLARSSQLVVVHLAGGTDAQPVLDALKPLLDEHKGLSLVALELNTLDGDGGPANTICTTLPQRALLCPVDAGVDSAMSLLAIADAVISTSPTARAVAASYGVPAVSPDATGLAALADHLTDPADPARDEQVRADQAALDAWFEEVAEQVRKAVGPADERAVLSATERYTAMEQAHAAMRARTSEEVLRAAESVPALEVVSADRQPEIDHLRNELNAIMSTRTMKVLKPARDAYSRLRVRIR